MATATAKKARLHRFHLPITTEEDLKAFILCAFGVRVPDVQVCSAHSTPWRAFVDAYFSRAPVIVWEASRGFGGKSFLLSLLGTVEAVTLRSDVNVLGGSGEQSDRILEHMGTLWRHKSAPTAQLASDVKREHRFVYGNKIKALMASTKSVRGPHPQRLRMDEMDEMERHIFHDAMGQTMLRDGVTPQTVLSSTHQYPDGTMTEVKNMAADRGWPVHAWCYKESLEPHGWLPHSEIDRKKLEVTEAMWLSEYELQEPSPEGRAINTEAVEKMFDRALGTYDGRQSEYVEINDPYKGGKHYTGADWAREQDRTEIVTLSVGGRGRPAVLVAYEQMTRLPWPNMVSRFEYQVKKYRSDAAHDATGVGNVVKDYMKVRARGFVMVGRARKDLFTDFIAAVERGEVKSPMITHLYRQLKFVTTDDVYGSGHPPDGLVALALAWHRAQHPREWKTGGY